MDFHSLKRRELQALCKQNNIPANITNAAMADALASLNTVEGVEEYLRQSEMVGSESPERSVITSPSAPRTSTRQKASKEVLECSNLTTRTRCGTRRRAVEGTDPKKTTTTRTTRRRAPQEASTQRKMEEDLQAKFEADLEQSDVSENNGLHSESTEVSEVSEVSVDQGGIQNEPEDEVPQVNEDQEVHVGNDPKDSREEDHVSIEATQGSTEMFSSIQKVDFHNLSRKELQNLCKKNKIPANISNAAMADALGSLEIVEGLEELLNESDCLTAKSPEMSRTSTRVRQTRTCQKSTRRKPAYAGSALGKIETVQKKEDSVVQSLAKKIESNMEDTECPTSVTTGKDDQEENDLRSHLEPCLEKSEVSDLVSENSSSNNAESKSISLPEEVSDESETSRIVMETEEEDQDDVIGNKFGGGKNDDTETDVCDFSKESVATVDNFVGPNSDDEVKPKEDQFPADILGQKESNLLESEDTVDSDALEIKGDGQEVNIKTFEEGDTPGVVESEPNVDEGLLQEAPEVGNDKIVEVFEVTDAADSNVAEHFSDGPKPVANFATENEDLKFDFVSVTEFSNDAQEFEPSSLEIVNVDKELENCQQELVNPAHDYPVEKLEGIQVEDQMTNTVDSESSTTQTDQLAPKVEGTPLCYKSLRTLKKMLKKRLQETTLATKMEKLSLDESEILLGNENSDAELTKEVGEDLKHEFEEIDKASDGLANKGVSWIDDARVPPVISGNSAIDNDNGKISSDQINGNSENLAINSTVDAEAQYAVNILQDDEISEASVVGHVNVESVNFDYVAPEESKQKADETQFSVIETDDITYPQVTPTKSSRKKPLLFTPSKCSSKTPKSAGRTNCVLDINKENIDNSGCKTGPGKVDIAVVGSGKLFSAMSMGKLKKEFKVLQQQSEKKRPALQSRSENQCPLASP